MTREYVLHRDQNGQCVILDREAVDEYSVDLCDSVHPWSEGAPPALFFTYSGLVDVQKQVPGLGAGTRLIVAIPQQAKLLSHNAASIKQWEGADFQAYFLTLDDVEDPFVEVQYEGREHRFTRIATLAFTADKWQRGNSETILRSPVIRVATKGPHEDCKFIMGEYTLTGDFEVAFDHPAQADPLRIDLSTVPAGMYGILLESPDGSVTDEVRFIWDPDLLSIAEPYRDGDGEQSIIFTWKDGFEVRGELDSKGREQWIRIDFVVPHIPATATLGQWYVFANQSPVWTLNRPGTGGYRDDVIDLNYDEWGHDEYINIFAPGKWIEDAVLVFNNGYKRRPGRYTDNLYLNKDIATIAYRRGDTKVNTMSVKLVSKHGEVRLANVFVPPGSIGPETRNRQSNAERDPDEIHERSDEGELDAEPFVIEGWSLHRGGEEVKPSGKSVFYITEDDIRVSSDAFIRFHFNRPSTFKGILAPEGAKRRRKLYQAKHEAFYDLPLKTVQAPHSFPILHGDGIHWTVEHGDTVHEVFVTPMPAALTQKTRSKGISGLDFRNLGYAEFIDLPRIHHVVERCKTTALRSCKDKALYTLFDEFSETSRKHALKERIDEGEYSEEQLCYVLMALVSILYDSYLFNVDMRSHREIAKWVEASNKQRGQVEDLIEQLDARYQDILDEEES